MDQDIIRIHFIPIFVGTLNNSTKNYVIKIIVKQGNPKEIYCDKDFNAYLRRDGRVEKLKVDIIKKQIICTDFNIERNNLPD